MRVLEMRNDFIKFELSNTDVSTANSLRRIIIAEVPTMCIETVDIYENSSVLPDEVISHRLGLIPLKSTRPMRDWNFQHSCTCEDGECDDCHVSLFLDMKFDGDSEELTTAVTSADISSNNQYIEVVNFANREEEQVAAEAAEKGITIVKIGKGQSLKLEMHAIKGISKEHSKWSPVATCALKYDAEIKLDESVLDDYTQEQKEELVNCCPTNVFEIDDATGKVSIARANDCIFCKECIFTAEEHRVVPEDALGVSVEHSEEKFTFTVETTGAMEAKEVVLDALEVLEQKIMKLQKATAACEQQQASVFM